MLLQEHISLRALNTLGVRARARYYARIDTSQALHDLLANPAFSTLPKLILGGGSNLLLVHDFEGIVIHMDIRGITTIKTDSDHVWVQAGAGGSWHQLVLYCVTHGYAGIENLSLIPGTVGAAPVQNIGAYGVELSDVFVSLEALDISSGEHLTFDSAICAFGYRESAFRNKLQGQYIILNITLRLRKQPSFQLSYGDLRNTLANMSLRELSIEAVSEAVIHLRRSKLPDPKRLGNAGSFFKNPVITPTQFNQLRNQYPQMPGHQQANNQIKIPAAWLIEQCGWKGKKRGAIGVHDQHALVLVNYGGGTGRDIYRLAREIQRSVEDRFCITLVPEVQIIGRP